MFQSKGERTIAALLDKYNIKYQYQPPTLVNDHGYQRIWYPDFGLPKYSVFIEYFGIKNDPIYDNRTQHKLNTYREADIAVIPVYPSHLKADYEKYILNSIYQSLNHKLSDLEQKIIATKNNQIRQNQNYSKKSGRY